MSKGKIVHLGRIEATSAQLEKAASRLAGVQGGTQKALVRALNRTIENSKAEAVRAVTDIYAIKAGAVRSSIFINKATERALNAEFVSIDENLPLKAFKVSPKTDTTGAKRRAIKAQIIKGEQLGNLKRAFIWRGHVFQRVGGASLPIEKRFGPAVPLMLNNEKVVSRVSDKAYDLFEKNLEHEIAHILDEVVQ